MSVLTERARRAGLPVRDARGNSNLPRHEQVYTLRTIESQLTSQGAERLQRCHDAECGLMQPSRKTCQGLHGAIICTGQSSRRLGSKPAEWLPMWAELLNGTADCPLWQGTAQ